MKKIFILITVLFLVSCTDNEMARKYGGSETIHLPEGKKLVNITWKEEHLWILTTNLTPNDTPQTYQFKETSSWGLLEGTITIIEKGLENTKNQEVNKNILIFE